MGRKDTTPGTRVIDRDELQHCAEQLAEDFLPPGWERVASSAYTRVAVNTERELYFKEFLPRSPAEALKSRLRSSRATRARNNADALRHAGIGAPENVAWGRVGRGREYLYMRAAPGRGIDAWLRETAGVSGSRAQRRALLADLGKFIGRVHASGFIHGDLRPGNILACAEHGHFRFTLIDNERNQRRRPPPGKMLLRNLMQLNMLPADVLGGTDRVRFYSAWCEQMRELSRAEAKILGLEAYAWAARRMRDASRATAAAGG